MRLTLGDALAVEIRHLLHEVMIVDDNRAVGADGERMLVARDWGARVGRGWPSRFSHELFLVCTGARSAR